jgi:hypothetical protein
MSFLCIAFLSSYKLQWLKENIKNLESRQLIFLALFIALNFILKNGEIIL